MDYIKKTYTDKAVEVQISSFAGKGGVTEYHVLLAITDRTLPFSGQLQNIQWAYVAVIQEVLPDDATAVFRRYFLSDAANQADLVMVWECENSYCPLSIVEQAPLNGSKIAMWTWFQTGITVETTKNGMSEQGCKLADNCIRTWFFVQNVDVNYAGVVKARKEVFITQDLTEKTHYISSTGIEGRHADPNVFVQMDTYAVKGLQSGQIQFLYAPTHLNPTYEYGVTFERGTAVTYGDRKQIFISGTASIDNQGEIMYPGDILKQTERMLENIDTLLQEAGSGLQDIMQAIVYLRDPADYVVVKQYIESRYPSFLHLIVHAPVCRPGWLIETECIAVIPADAPQYAYL